MPVTISSMMAREPVDGEIEAYGEGAALDPGEVVLGVGRVEVARPRMALQRPGKRQDHAADGEDVDHALREAAAEDAVDQEAGEGEDWDEPELHG